MRKCPNCGQAAERTEDWACQWCGYPLLSNSYKKVPKGYKQLKEERHDEQELPPPEETVVPLLPRRDIVAPTYILESKLRSQPVSEPELEVAPEPEVIPKSQQPQPVSEPELEVAPEPEMAPKPELELKAVPEPASASEAVPQSVSTAGGITVEELYAAFSVDEVAADANYTGKTLDVAGVVDRITANDVHHIYYIILSSADKKQSWNVRCTFDGKHISQLSRLVTGQMVMVRGEYDGYKTNILLRNCVLIS
jgi:hypothetical protein